MRRLRIQFLSDANEGHTHRDYEKDRARLPAWLDACVVDVQLAVTATEGLKTLDSFVGFTMHGWAEALQLQPPSPRAGFRFGL